MEPDNRTSFPVTVYDNIKEIKERLTKIEETLVDLRILTAELKIKAGIWGVVGGITTVAVAVGIAWLKGL